MQVCVTQTTYTFWQSKSVSMLAAPPPVSYVTNTVAYSFNPSAQSHILVLNNIPKLNEFLNLYAASLSNKISTAHTY
jgi:hypothetical protein